MPNHDLTDHLRCLPLDTLMHEIEEMPDYLFAAMDNLGVPEDEDDQDDPMDRIRYEEDIQPRGARESARVVIGKGVCDRKDINRLPADQIWKVLDYVPYRAFNETPISLSRKLNWPAIPVVCLPEHLLRKTRKRRGWR